MVKSKKDKKDVETVAEEMNTEMDSKTKVKKGGKSSKDKKSLKSEEINEVDILSVNAEKLSINQKEDSNDEVEVEKLKQTKKKNKKPKKNDFELLMDDNDFDEDDNKDSHQEPISDVDETEIKVGEKNNKKDKKGKKAKKKKNQEDEDIDSVLAELEMEYAGVKVERSSNGIEESATTKTKIAKVQENNPSNVETLENEQSEDQLSTVKTAAQKKKEKKERQKREAALKKSLEQSEKKSSPDNDFEAEKSEEIVDDFKEKLDNNLENSEEISEDTKKDDKKKKKKDKPKKEKDEEKDKKKGVNKAMVLAMQERLKKIKEEEERLQREEEERIRQEEEREQMRLEQIRLEQEKKEKRKQKEAEKKARLKAEGKLLTKKQKEDLARAKAMLEARKAQGLDIPDPNEKRAPRLGTRIRPNKKKDSKKQDTEREGSEENKDDDQVSSENLLKESTSSAPDVQEEVIVKDAWDESSSESEDDSKEEQKVVLKKSQTIENKTNKKVVKQENKSESEDESSDESSSQEDNVEEYRNDLEAMRERAVQRIEKRRVDSEQKRTAENLREAVVCVLGHVDTGKTKILDKLRRTHVQDSEAGGITQQIGATNVPIDAIKEQTKVVKGTHELQFKLPGLLIIDTPGHESFSNLRNRGSSLCDISILVVDIMHGLEPQTIESINLLKSKKCPFIVALNKIDRLYDWQTIPRKDVRDVIKAQQSNTQLEFTQRTKEIILQFAEQGLNAALFYENPDPRSYVSLVPTSAITGEGMGNLLYLIVEACQTLLAKRLMYSEELQAIVLEVKAIPGLGTTIDTILINGRLREGDTIILAGTDGPIVTQIRSLLMPQPLKELRVKNAYKEYKEVKAAQGVKIAGKDLEKAIAGINLLVAHKPDEIEICKEEVAKELKHALSHIKLSDRGVYVQASTLGSLEALLEFLKSSKISYSGIRIGPVVKKDVVKASVMLEHDPQYATILAFDVKVERDAQELADSLGVKIFQADIIYHLFDKFMAYRDELKQKKRDEFKSIAVFPCKLKILPHCVFNTRDPIVIGVMVENGIVKEGTPLCVPSKEFVDIGVVTSIELNHKQIESARKGQEVCIKIDPIPGESPKMFNRHFDASDMLVSKISRQSIDACKDYFRDDLIKSDWQLMVELKKLFEIL